MNHTRAFWITAVTVVLAAIYWFGIRVDPEVEKLNQALAASASPELKNYPYPFRVLRLQDGVALMATPRSSSVPVIRMIGAIHPHLSGKSADHPDFMAAQMELAKVQSEAREIVLKQPGVSQMKWELDQNWLIAHNIPLN